MGQQVEVSLPKQTRVAVVVVQVVVLRTLTVTAVLVARVLLLFAISVALLVQAVLSHRVQVRPAATHCTASLVSVREVFL